MAQTLVAKPATALQRYEWPVPVGDTDSLATAVLSVTSGAATISKQSVEGDNLAFWIDGGTNNTVCVFGGLATTNLGQELVETFYLPIIGSAALLAPTARDVCYFALRKIVGQGETPSATMLADALERLNDLLTAWKAMGADVGAKLPLVAADTLTMPDEFILGIKYSLLLAVAALYGAEVAPTDAFQASVGLQVIKQRRIPAERGKALYY